MNKFTYHVLLTSVLLALSVGANAEAKAAPTRLTTDPAITEKAIAAQMNQVNSENNVNFNNMLLQKNLGDSIAETAAPKSSTLDIDLRGAVTLAIQNNRDITIAELQRREAEADVSAAAAKKNPSLSDTWSAGRAKSVGEDAIGNSFGNGLFPGRFGREELLKVPLTLQDMQKIFLTLKFTGLKLQQNFLQSRHITIIWKLSSLQKYSMNQSAITRAI